MARLAFHLHTDYSNDSNISLESAIKQCEGQGIDVLCVTDHNTINRFSVSSSIARIIGEEINTKEGEVIGIFLKSEIPMLLSLRETLDRIHDQGGISIVPHPFDRVRRKTIHTRGLYEHRDQIDIVEVYNSRTILSNDNQRALEFAERYQKLTIIGSDAHTMREYGNIAWMDGISIESPRHFLESLRTYSIHHTRASLSAHIESVYVKWKGKILH